jgi:3-isopropylmalate dehydrogenase
MPRIAVLPGDGIGAEVTRQAIKVLRRVAADAQLELDLDERDFGAGRYVRTGTAITEAELAELETEYDAILLGTLGDPRVPDHAHVRAILSGLRARLDLYIDLRPIRLLDPSLSPLGHGAQPVDLVVYGENAGGTGVGIGGQLHRGTSGEVVLDESVSTWNGAERLLRAAFEHAQSAGPRSVALAEHPEAMPHRSDLWRRAFAEVGAEYPDVERQVVHVEMLASDLVFHPARYGIIIAPSLVAGMVSHFAAGLAGRPWLVPRAELHPGRPGLFRPMHGPAYDLAGTDRANPTGTILAAALLLDRLGFAREAARIEAAVRRSIRLGQTTPDLGGTLGTDAVGDWICRELGEADL